MMLARSDHRTWLRWRGALRLAINATLLLAVVGFVVLRSHTSLADVAGRADAVGPKRVLLQDLIDGPCDPQKQSRATRCEYTRMNEDCGDYDGLANYTHMHYCGMEPHGLAWLSIIILVLIVIVAIRFLGETAEEFLAPNMGKISDVLHLSHNMAGVTFLAFANSAPDFFASYVALTGNSPALGMGDLLGNAVFTPVIATVVVGFMCHGVQITRFSMLRDMVFFLASGIMSLGIILYKHISVYHAAITIGIYFVYVIFVFSTQYYVDSTKNEAISIDDLAPKKPDALVSGKSDYSQLNKKTPDDADNADAAASVTEGATPSKAKKLSDDDDDDEPLVKKHNPNLLSVPGGGDVAKQQRKRTMSMSGELEKQHPRLMAFARWTGAPMYFLGWMTVPNTDADTWDIRLILVNLTLSPILIVFTFSSPPYGLVPLNLLWAAIGGFATGIAMIVHGSPKVGGSTYNEPKWKVLLIVLAIVTCVSWLYLIANELVTALSLIGLILDINEALLGLTILCWGNNISDVIGVSTVAHLGYPEIALGAIWASPLLDTTLTAGVGWLIKTLDTGTTTYPYDFSLLITNIWMIGIAVISIVVYQFLTDFKLSKRFAWFLIAYYVANIIIIIAGPQDETV